MKLRSVLSFLIFLFCFTVEIRVKASNPQEQLNPPLQKPEGCYGNKNNPCVFSSGEKILKLQLSNGILNLKNSTTLERNDKNHFQYLNGTIWIQSNEKMVIDSLYGSVESDRGEFWIVENDKKITIRSVIGLVKVNINSVTLEIPEGFQVWISGKDNTGKNTYGVPENIPIESHLKLWSELFTGTRAEFKERVSILKSLYKDKNVDSAEFYQRIADRHVASVNEKKLAAQREAQRRKQYLQELRKLYFEKVFER